MAKQLNDYEPALKYGAMLNAKIVSATGAANAATCSGVAGRVTTESLSTAAGAEEIYTVTNTQVKATDMILWSVANGTNTTVAPAPCSATPASGSIVFYITNTHAASALNGTLVINFLIVRR